MSTGMYSFHMFAAFMELVFAIAVVHKVKLSEKIGMVIHIICAAVYTYSFACLSVATSYSEAVLAIKMEYAAAVFLVISIMLMVNDYYDLQMPKLVFEILLVINLVVLIGVMTFEHHTLFYTSIQVTEANGYIKLITGHGILYYLNVANMVFSTGYSAGYVFAYFRKRKEALHKECILICLSILLPTLSFATYFMGLTGDVLSIALFISDTIFVVLIFRNKLFDVLRYTEVSVMDNMTDGILVLDDERYVLEYNLTMEKITDGEMRRGEKLPAYLKSLEVGEESEYIHSGRIYEIQRKPVVFHNVLHGYLLIFKDMTDSRAQMEEWRQLKNQAEAANRAKSEFLANMSHELRTPINVIMGMNQMIRDRSRDADVEGYTDHIDEAGQLLLSLINEVLDFSKIEAGRMEIFHEPYLLFDLLREVVNMIQLRANQKKLAFVTDIDPNLPTMPVGDEIHLRQVLLNILDNAVKYTSEGTVTLRVSADTRDEKTALTVVVSDTGRGMKPEDLKRLFTPFQRIEVSAGNFIQGTGLGMSITRELLHKMDSELQVESVYGEGSTFTFTVLQDVQDVTPIGNFAERCKEKKETKNNKAPFIAPNAAVLVVDDSSMNCEVVKGLLSKTAIQIFTAYSGEDALQLTEKQPFDLIFMDHMMPGMDGTQTMYGIQDQKDGCNQKTPIIVLTANAIAGARERFLKQGFNGYLSKPVGRKELYQALEEWIPAEKKLNATGETISPDHTENAPKEQKPQEQTTNEETKQKSQGEEQPGAIPGLNYKKAMEFCDNEVEFYQAMLAMFVKEWDVKIVQLDTAFAEENWKSYIVLSHGLKNNAVNVGAMVLSAMAKDMEFAGKEERYDYIHEQFPYYRHELKRVLELIRKHL